MEKCYCAHCGHEFSEDEFNYELWEEYDRPAVRCSWCTYGLSGTKVDRDYDERKGK